MSTTEVFSLGVEEEYQIVDPTSRELDSIAEEIVQEAQKTLGKDVQLEIQLSQVEVATPVCASLAEVRDQLTRLRGTVIDVAHVFHKRIASSGTHPFSLWQEQPFTPRARYLALERDYQQLAREQAIFGCHVHVGISQRELGLQIMNQARTWLSPLIALTANSPFWCGLDTGYASYRIPHWGAGHSRACHSISPRCEIMIICSNSWSRRAVSMIQPRFIGIFASLNAILPLRYALRTSA